MGKWEPYIIHDIILPIIMKGDLIHFTINTSGTGYAGDVLLPWLRRPDGALHTQVSKRPTLVSYQLGYVTLLQEHVLERNPLLRGPAYTVASVFPCNMPSLWYSHALHHCLALTCILNSCTSRVRLPPAGHLGDLTHFALDLKQVIMRGTGGMDATTGPCGFVTDVVGNPISTQISWTWPSNGDCCERFVYACALMCDYCIIQLLSICSF